MEDAVLNPRERRLAAAARRAARGQSEQPTESAALTDAHRALADAHEALGARHAEEAAAHDLARKMLAERGEEILALRAAHEKLEGELVAALRDRDAMKAMADAFEAQLTAPAAEPAEDTAAKPTKRR